MDIKNILVIGSGLIGKVHAELCLKNPHINLIGFVVSDTVKHHDLCNKFNCLIYGSIESALESNKVDGVIIASPSKLHLKNWITCLKYDLPALIEKPIILNTDDFYNIPKEYREPKNLQNFTVGHHRLHGTNILEAKKTINSGALGQIKMIQSSTAWVKPDYYFKDGIWRTDLSQGGGVLHINLIHEIATVQYLFGEIEYVTALSGKPSRPYNVEDTVCVSFKLKTGAVGTFSITDSCPGDQSWECNSRENLMYPQQKNNCLFIYGSDALLKLPSNSLIYHEEAQDWWEPVKEKIANYEIKDPLYEQLMQFVKFLNGECAHRISIEDGLQNVAVIEAINKSISSKSSIKVEKVIQ